MQLFPTTASQGTPSANDGAGNDLRTGADPSSGDDFRAALSSARQNADRASVADRKPGRSRDAATGDAADQSDADALDPREITPAMLEADALAALLPILTPTPLVTAPEGATPDAASGAAQATGGVPDVSFKAPAPGLAVAASAPQGAGEAGGGLARAAEAADNGIAHAANAAMMRFLRPTGDGEAAPVPVADGVPPVAAPAPRPMPTGGATVAASSATPGPGATAAGSTIQGLLSAAQALFGGVSGDPAPAAATGSGLSSLTWTTPTVQPLASAPSWTWADFAAEFEARIIAATSTAATGGTGAATATGEPTSLIDEAADIGTGSTADAAGASASANAAAAVELPGTAVAGAGAASASAEGFGDALDANVAPSASGTAARAERTDEPHAAAISAAGAHQAGRAEAADGAAQPAPAGSVQVASQVADAALAAARRPGQSVAMVLQPEGLGSVSLRVTVERGGLSVHLAVENAGTREIVQASWPQLQQAFEQRGLTVQALLLDLSGGRGGSEAFQNFQQFAGQQFGGQHAMGQQWGGQQPRAGSGGTGREQAAPVGALDEGSRPLPGAAASGRVDYRI